MVNFEISLFKTEKLIPCGYVIMEMFRRLPTGHELSQKADGTMSAHMELGTLQAENGQ